MKTKGFTPLQNVDEIDISGNQFQNIPERFYVLPKLKHLNMSSNLLTSIPELQLQVKNTKNFQSILMVTPKDTDVTVIFQRLTILNISSNRITQLWTPKNSKDEELLRTLFTVTRYQEIKKKANQIIEP